MNRRSFLKRGFALAASGLMLPELVAAEPERRVWALDRTMLHRPGHIFLDGLAYPVAPAIDDALWWTRLTATRSPERIAPYDTSRVTYSATITYRDEHGNVVSEEHVIPDTGGLAFARPVLLAAIGAGERATSEPEFPFLIRLG